MYENYLVTWHRAIDGRTEQILASSLEKAQSQGRVFGFLGYLAAKLGFPGSCSVIRTGNDGIFVICKNGSERRISGNGFSADKTFYVITCYKRFSPEMAIGAVDCPSKVDLAILKLAGKGYNGRVIVNEISSRGIYTCNFACKTRVPHGTEQDTGYAPEFCLIPPLKRKQRRSIPL